MSLNNIIQAVMQIP